jgi:hypothetical protein
MKGGETVPIKWSAVKVSEAMDEVENQLSLAEAFIDAAKVKANQARKIAGLPQYLDQRLVSLISELGRIDRAREAISNVRRSIPEGAIEAERAKARNGSQRPLI